MITSQWSNASIAALAAGTALSFHFGFHRPGASEFVR